MGSRPTLWRWQSHRTRFEVFLGQREATAGFGYDHIVGLEGQMPRPCCDRALSPARPPLRPKRSAYGLAGLRSSRAGESVLVGQATVHDPGRA